MFLVYLIHCIPSGKYYVGWTGRSFADRWLEHCDSARKCKDLHLSNAIRLYGENSFYYEILAIVGSKKEAKHLEKLWILTLRAFDREYGYNMTYGGEGGSLYRKNPSSSLKGKSYTEQFGEEEQAVRKRHSEGLLNSPKVAARRGINVVFSEQHRKNISLGMKNGPRMHWVTNEIINSKIRIEQPVPEGWRIGIIKNYKDTPESNAKRSKSCKVTWKNKIKEGYSQQLCQKSIIEKAAKVSAANTGSRWITNGKEQRRVWESRGDVIPQGWRYGVKDGIFTEEYSIKLSKAQKEGHARKQLLRVA